VVESRAGYSFAQQVTFTLWATSDAEITQVYLFFRAMGDDLAQLPFLVRLSHKTRRTVTANIAFALAVKAAVFALAMAGLATLWMAVVADVGASLAVILNGARLRRM